MTFKEALTDNHNPSGDADLHAAIHNIVAGFNARRQGTPAENRAKDHLSKVAIPKDSPEMDGIISGFNKARET